jgi:D-alanine-D-alanine ligase
VEYNFPPELEPRIEQGIREATLRLFQTLRLRDFARFDFRVDSAGGFYFLEVNPLPGLSPDSGDLVILSRKRGWSYQELVVKITDAAFSRYPCFSGRPGKTKNIAN